MSSSSVPVIDAQGWKRPPVSEFANACRSMGFFQLQGHGLHRDVLDVAVSACDAFFSLPVEEKLRVRMPAADANRGFSGLGTEALAYTLGAASEPDSFEAFTMGPTDRFAAGVDGRYRHLFFPNIWPERPSALRAALERYFVEVRAVTYRIMDTLAAALDLDAGFFTNQSRRSADALRSIFYPSPPDSISAPTRRLGEHTDYGLITVLWADSSPGLQILDENEDWLDVVPEPGALIVNLGDLLAQWTNDRWRSTIHRVKAPASQSAPPRRSLAFFHNADPETLVSCLPACVGPGEKPRYNPVLAGDHYLAKLASPREMAPSTATSTVGSRLVGRLDPAQG